MKRGLIAGAVMSALGAAALWLWSAAPHEAVVLAQTRPVAPSSSAASAGQGGPWALLAEATRQADASDPKGKRFCGAPFMDEGAEPTDAMKERLERHVKDAIAAQVKRLALAPDELGRLTAAILSNDVTHIGEIGRTTTDPLVYGLALRSCPRAFWMTLLQEDPTRFERNVDDTRRTHPACDALTAQRWTELDPDNAAAWWTLASQSTSQAAALQAMLAAKSASRVSGTQGQLITRIAADGPVDAAVLLPVSMVTMGVDGAEFAVSSTGLRRACGRTGPARSASAAGPASPAALEVCRDLALDVIDKDPVVINRFIASKLAISEFGVPEAALPYSPDVLRKLVAEFDAWRAPESAKGNHDMGCPQVARLVEADIERAKVGEVEILRHLGKMPPPRSRAAASAPTP